MPKQPGMNPVPIVIAVIVLLAGGVYAVQTSWIGQLMRRGPVQDDPMDKITMPQARDAIENGITSGLTAVGAKGTFKYMVAGQPASKADPKPVELSVDTELKDPKEHKAIVDPIKPYMEKAQISTLTMSDKKSHATWTYNLAPPTPAGGDQPAAE